MSEDERLLICGDYESTAEFLELVDWVFESIYLGVSQRWDRFMQIL